jgi:hypothetical protein
MSKSFDFVVKAENVVIKQQSDNNYKVKINDVDFLKYQTWSNTNANNINDDRKVYLVSTKKWVELFKTANSDVSNPFTPTTVIEIDNKKFVTVMTNVKFKNNKVTFYVSTDDVTFDSKKIKKMNKLPKGEFHNVRFDIDGSSINLNPYCMSACPVDFFSPPAPCSPMCSGESSCFNSFNDGPIPQSTSNQTNITNFCTYINNLPESATQSEWTNEYWNTVGNNTCSIL